MPDNALGLDLSLAYAQGGAMMTDGVYRFSFVHRDESEVYFSANLTY